MRNKLKPWCFSLVLALPFGMSAQKDAPIVLTNPSFEDLPKMGETPAGRYNCGKAGETPPDVQPGGWTVAKPANHGQTYLGLVVRDNETWEAVSQRLSRPIEGGKCYEFTLDLCRTELYLSLSRTTGEEVNYATPARLILWGGNGYCDKAELLWQTPEITHTRWLGHTMTLKPKRSYSYIILEAYYKTPVLFPYNGNILIDNASPIQEISCAKPPKKEEPAVASTGPKKTPDKVTTKEGPKTPVTPVEPRSTASAAPKVTTKMERKNLRKGDIIRLEKVYFEANKFELQPESMQSLQALFNFLKENPDVSVEVGGHTNNRPEDNFAIDLSTNRAKAVSDWLVSQGIDQSRVQFKGYGKKYPIDSNLNEEGRKKNQRVEIKILNING